MTYERMKSLQEHMTPEEFWAAYGPEILTECRASIAGRGTMAGTESGRDLLEYHRRLATEQVREVVAS